MAWAPISWVLAFPSGNSKFSKIGGLPMHKIESHILLVPKESISQPKYSKDKLMISTQVKIVSYFQ